MSESAKRFGDTINRLIVGQHLSREETLDLDWDIGFPSWKNPKPGHLKIILNERQ